MTRAPLDLPPAFVEKNRADPEWLRALPELLGQLAAHWSLTFGPPIPGIIWNYVVPAKRSDGVEGVLKVSRHVEETRNEIAALRLWDGDGAVHLLSADPERGALLTERLHPGTMLTDLALADDDAATVVAASTLGRLWRPAPEGAGLRPLSNWCAAYDRLRDQLSRGEGGFPAELFRRADSMRHDLLASTTAQTVLHGDMHHFNVLRAGDGWLVIDPKGLSGDRHFDVCQFLFNPFVVTGPGRDIIPLALIRRRIDVFCSELGLDRQRVREWAFVHAVLDACWNVEDGELWNKAVAWAERTLSF